MGRKFRNDYSELAHPRVMEALTKHCLDQNVAYGLDAHSEHAARLIREAFGAPDASVFFLAGGTQTNATFISKALRPYEAVIAASSGHINVHETGAVEATGHKIIVVPPTPTNIWSNRRWSIFPIPPKSVPSIPKPNSPPSMLAVSNMGFISSSMGHG